MIVKVIENDKFQHTDYFEKNTYKKKSLSPK